MRPRYSAASTNERSDSSAACGYRHNAPTESFFNSLKNERVHGTRYATREEAIADLFDYIEVFYNRSAATPRSDITRRFSSCKTGSRVSMSGK